uniref:Adhesion G-protein coupled receptor D1-like n=1 Tax=Phallusia mammillata TaxID=59560 RepID=A0A6F9D6F4_9ASCI|nr:adhesion G-protein coupled receptor D1-like [Phallusia mammillata]
MLASSFWMMLEGITLVLKTTNQSMMLTSQHQRKLNGIRFALGWGVPAAVVSVALSIGYTHDIYMDKLDLTTNGSVIYKRCWLAPNMVIYSVMVPIGLVLLANTVILVKVAYFVHLKSSQANRFKPAVKRRQSFVNYEDLSATLKAVLTLLPVLGLPWIVSFLVGFGENPSIILIYANAVVNGLQGLFLFLLYCINSRVVRKLIMRKTIAGALSRPSGAATSVSAGTAMTSSQFRNGSN